jgi:hypothetical protein
MTTRFALACHRPSARAMPDRRPKGRLWKVPQAFRGARVATRPLNRDGLFGVSFAARHVAHIDLSNET